MKGGKRDKGLMTNDRLAIGFIGFGEAGFHLAKGLRSEGLRRIFAYDINTLTPRLGERIRERARISEVELLQSSQRLARTCEVLFSTVTADAALDAAKQTAPFLDSSHLYAISIP